MVLGEVGRHLIETEAKCRVFGFWYGLCNTSNSESPNLSAMLSYIMHASINSHGLREMHPLLDHSLRSAYVWSNQVHSIKSLFFKCTVRQRLRDQTIQEW